MPPPVVWSPEERDWAVHADCERCGGYRMLLQVRDPAHHELAETRAAAFISRIHARGSCLGCESRAWRDDERPTGGDQPQVWWDTETGEWMAWTPLPGCDGGASIPLGIRTFWAPQEVRAAARALWTAGSLPLRVATGREAVEDESTIWYDVESGRWVLRSACFRCGGFELRLTSFGRGAVEAACDEAMTCLELVAREGCPHCRTLDERSAERSEDGEPRIWFDTVSRDWLVWQPVEGSGGGVTLPLGLGRFDARRPLVYRAAASVLFDSELFLDEGH